MPEINFQTFLQQKDQLAWKQAASWTHGVGAVRHLVWKGYFVENGRVIDIPSYFAYITVDDKSGNIGIALSANVRFDVRGRGQKVIDKFVVGHKHNVSEHFLSDVMRQRYGLVELDFVRTPVAPIAGYGFKDPEKILIRKTMYNKADQLLALVFLRKNEYARRPTQYCVNAVIVSTETGIPSETGYRSHKPVGTSKEGMEDFYRTLRQFVTAGFSSEVEIPEGAKSENWNFDLGVSMDVSKQISSAFESAMSGILSYSELDQFSDPIEDSVFDYLQAACGKKKKTAQDTSTYYQGHLPSADQLTQYVGTSSVEASQLKGIFGGVDEAISLVNQFNSSLLLNVTFIYNVTGGSAYGVYMSALDNKIKEEELKKLLKMDGYQIKDMPNGDFYATHDDKDKNQIDSEIAAYRQKVDSCGITTFGIDMNRVISAARADASEGNILDQQDQYLLGVMHLGSTMVHEAIHSQGAQQEGPSENAESEFMQWVMPIINQRRQQRYKSEGREEEYAPLVVQTGTRRMASSNWLEKASADGVVVRTAQYGAQFLHNQEYVKKFGPTQWSTAYWNFGVGAIESMLDNVRPVPTPPSPLSFEGQLRKHQEGRWENEVDTGDSTEELLEAGRIPLEAYRSTETLMEDGRERPFMLPVKAITKQAWSGSPSYDSGKDAFGWMSNLDIPMEDRIQPWDNNDEETTWFDRKFIRNQPRYNPEYGNPMSKENGIYSWWVDPRLQIEQFDRMVANRPLMTAPAARFASDTSSVKSFVSILERALKGIVRKKILGTRFVCSQHIVPFIKKYFENDADIGVLTFGEGLVAVWVVSSDIPKKDIEACEHYVKGDSDDASDRKTFEYVTGLPKVRSESISAMIAAVQLATRDADVNMLIVGDLPLAVKTGCNWDVIRTVDFCSDDPDACVKIGEIVCDKIGAEYHTCSQVSRSGDIIIAHYGCVTFRFLGGKSLDSCVETANAIGVEPTFSNCEIISRQLTPLMLAMDVVTENIIDPTGEATPDVEAKVVRSAFSPSDAVSLNPLSIVDAVFIASAFDFAIDSDFSDSAAKAEMDNAETKYVWEAIRSAGKGKCLATAEQYGINEPFSAMMGE